MKQYFDTSVLVSAFVEDERCHEECAEAVANAKDGVVSAHALAECFAILTGGHLTVRLLPDAAAQIIETNVYSRMKVMTLTARETMGNLTDCHRLGIRGGGVYDSLHIAAARKADAAEILTLNLRHFTAFAPDLAPIIRAP
jgi:predicted nucleic acid-binding protein